jgi:anti-sigma-K factor RskA
MTTSDHEELRNQLGAFALGALDPAEQAEVRAHLAVCDECAAEVRALRPVVDALARSTEPVDPPAAVRRRLLSSIVMPAVPEPTTAVKPLTVTTSRSVLPWLAAAASLVLAAALGVYASQLRGRVQTLEQELREAILQVQAGERQTAQARLVATNAQRQLSVIAAPDVAQVALKGQAVAPQASARALWSRSRGLLLSASNLPALPAGRTYQLWVISGKMPPISDGWIFQTDASGGVTTMFTTPATLPVPTAMAVSIEPDGGSTTAAGPTGALYLVGSLN